MIEATRQRQMLRRAREEGLLTPDEVARLVEDVERWGPLLAALTRGGDLSPANVERLLGGDGAAMECAPDGPFELGRLLGEGAMGRVFEAWDVRLGRRVALKLLRGTDEDEARRFQREAKAQARVDHPNVCKVYGTGTLDGTPYIAMQRVDGETLAHYQEGGGAAPHELTVDQKARIVEQVARGIHAAHCEGLIHRDVKPSNVMVELREDGDWRPVVLDFGLARPMAAPAVTSPGMTAGTPHFMSPEQVRGERSLDRRTDVYSLGATAFALLAGKPPFDAPSSLDVMVQVVEEEPPELAGVPPDLAAIVGKCLQKRPGDRYESARALADDLRRYLDGEPVAARRIGLARRLARKARRHRAVTLVTAVALLALAGLGTASVRAQIRAREREGLARQLGQEVRTVASEMRVAYLQPPHPLGREKASIRRRMERVAAQMDSLGAMARGPGSYALGRGHLALGEVDAARRALEAAWSSGYRDPEVAAALGRTLAQLYQGQLQEVERIADEALRASRRQAIETELRDVALGYLARSDGGEEEPASYVAALVSFLEGRYEESIDHSRAAFAEVAWLHEAKMLEGEAWAALARGHQQRGEDAAMEQAYAAAEAAYCAAAEVGESDPAIYERLCDLAALEMTGRLYGGAGDLEGPFELGRQACEQAIAIDPDRAEGHGAQATLYFRLGEHRLRHGEDPRPSFTVAIAAARRSLERHEQRHVLDALGNTYMRLADYQRAHGADPRPSYQRAAAAHRRATALDPRSWSSYSNLGNALLRSGFYLASIGEDPRDAYGDAVAAYGRSIAIEPDVAYVQSNVGLAYKAQGDYAAAMGQRPEDSLRRAIAAYRRAIEINPRFTYAHHNLGGAYLALAMDQERRGEDPRATLEEAAASLGRAIDIDPGYANARAFLAAVSYEEARYEMTRGHFLPPLVERAIDTARQAIAIDRGYLFSYDMLGAAYRLRAEHRVLSGADPAAALEEARSAYAAGLAQNPERASLATGLAESWLLAARSALERGADPRPSFEAARREADRSLAANPGQTEARLALGRLGVLTARWRIGRHLDPTAALDEARAALAAAADRNPGDPEARLLLAEVERWRGEWLLGRGAAPDAAVAQGLARVAEAMAIHPRMARALAVEAALHGIAARSSGDLSAGGPCGEARAALERALTLNPRLEDGALQVCAAQAAGAPAAERSSG